MAGSSERGVEPDQGARNRDHRGARNGDSSSRHRYPSETKSKDCQCSAVDEHAAAIRAGFAPADRDERDDAEGNKPGQTPDRDGGNERWEQQRLDLVADSVEAPAPV